MLGEAVARGEEDALPEAVGGRGVLLVQGVVRGDGVAVSVEGLVRVGVRVPPCWCAGGLPVPEGEGEMRGVRDGVDELVPGLRGVAVALPREAEGVGVRSGLRESEGEAVGETEVDPEPVLAMVCEGEGEAVLPLSVAEEEGEGVQEAEALSGAV